MSARGSPPIRTVAVAAARPALAWVHRRAPAQVIHVFDDAAYLADEQGRIVLLARPAIGLGPFSVRLEPTTPPLAHLLRVGDEPSFDGASMSVGRLSVDFAHTAEWRPRPAWPRLRCRPVDWASAMGPLRETIAAAGRGGIFSAGSSGGPASFDRDLRERASAQTAALLFALAEGRQDALASAAEGLAGLGGGFTPAGDDYLVGTMLALWATWPPRLAARLSRRLAEAAIPRTTRASAAWLEAAARGMAAEPWHALVEAIATGSAEALRAAAARILRTGHTSGEDALAGFLAAVETIRRVDGAPRAP